MIDPTTVLKGVDTILLVDWPAPDVPDSLARAGFRVFISDGPEPDAYSVHEVVDGEIVNRKIGRPPEQADLVYVHRPVDELRDLVTMAKELRARTIWYQSGLASDGTRDARGVWLPDDRAAEARSIVESAGLDYVDRPYIGDLADTAVARTR